MANLYRSSVLSQSITTTSGTPHLPNELLLHILLQVAHSSSRSLPTLYRINRHWYHLIKRYELLLWKTATLATFPDVTLPDREGEGSGSQAARWKRVYGIHLGWESRKAQVLLVKPQRPEPRSAQSVSLTTSMLTTQQQQQQVHGHVHDHHQLALLEHHGQHVAFGSDNRDHGHASSSSSSSHPHEPPMVIHSTAVSSSLCIVKNETVVSYGTCLDHNHDSNSSSISSHSSNNSYGGRKDGSHAHSFSVDPQHDEEEENEEEEEDTLSCSLCTYADLCLIPQLQICVRVHRNRNQSLMQVLDWSLQHGVEMEGGVESQHQDLISGTAVNESGTMMASCSIDGTVRVWDLNQAFAVAAGRDREPHHRPLYRGASTGEAFLDKVERWGCPIKSRWLLTGHVGWVNAVAIEETMVVSGGSDHTVHVWDALTGTLKYIIPDLYTSRPELGLGVYAVAIQGQSVIGSGSVMEGYQLHDLNTGELIFELDEPLSSRDHVRFENELYQQYASRIAITDTVVVTNSKMEGMLCVWSRQTGELMYRIHASSAAIGGSRQDVALSRARWRGQQQQKVPGREEVQSGRLVTFEASESSLRIRREGVAAAANAANVANAAAAAVRIHGEEETVHTFKINKSGSMLMCTLCDGRATLIEFGSKSRAVNDRSWVVEASGHGSLLAQADVQRLEHQQRQEHSHHCGALAWAWMGTHQGRNRVVLV